MIPLAYNETNKKLTPKLYRGTQQVTSGVTFTYACTPGKLVYIDKDGTIRLQKRQTGTEIVTIGAKINGNSLPGVTTTCTINVVESKADGLTIDVANATTKRELSKGNMFFGVMDTTKNGSSPITVPSEMLTSVQLTATVDSDTASDASRVQWSIPAASKNYISFASNSSKITATGANVTVYMRKAGTKVTLNASVDGSKDATYTFDIWQGVCYKDAKAPAVAGPISSVIDTIKNLKERDIEVKLVQSDLPVKDVTPVKSGTKYKFDVELDGKYTSDKTFYYPIDGKRTVTTEAVDISDITIEDQPESSLTYKLDGTSMKLAVSDHYER